MPHRLEAEDELATTIPSANDQRYMHVATGSAFRAFAAPALS